MESLEDKLEDVFSKLKDIVNEDWPYEQKMMAFDYIKRTVNKHEREVQENRIAGEGKCPHKNTVNATTLADPPDTVKVKCFDCGETLIYREGILQNGNNETE